MVMDGDAPVHDSEAEEAEEKKEARKAKNRQSAAASRARQQAYTTALEIKVRHIALTC